MASPSSPEEQPGDQPAVLLMEMADEVVGSRIASTANTSASQTDEIDPQPGPSTPPRPPPIPDSALRVRHNRHRARRRSMARPYPEPMTSGATPVRGEAFCDCAAQQSGNRDLFCSCGEEDYGVLFYLGHPIPRRDPLWIC